MHAHPSDPDTKSTLPGSTVQSSPLCPRTRLLTGSNVMGRTLNMPAWVPWIPIVFVALMAVPAVLGLDARRNPPFQSFRERMRAPRSRAGRRRDQKNHA
jgi:hypothetical protein